MVKLLLPALLGTAVAVTPIEKVLQMMEEMVAKGDAAKKDEEVKFAAFNQWCIKQTEIKNKEIEAGTTRIDELNAEIEKCDSDIRALTDRIEELDEDVGRWKGDEQAAQAVRDREAADFKATVSDYTESLDALGQAINVLQNQNYRRDQAALVQSLVQVQRLRVVPYSTKQALAAFLQQPVADSIPDVMPADNLAVSAPEANAYEFQSGGVVDMLVKLEDEFKTKKADLEEEELKA